MFFTGKDNKNMSYFDFFFKYSPNHAEEEAKIVEV